MKYQVLASNPLSIHKPLPAADLQISKWDIRWGEAFLRPAPGKPVTKYCYKTADIDGLGLLGKLVSMYLIAALCV